MMDISHSALWLATDGSGGMEPGALPGTTGDVGGAGGPAGNAGGGTATGSPGSGFMIIMLMFVVALIIFSVFGQRREKKRRESLLSSIRKHDRVQTAGGVIGAVVDIRDDEVVLKVDEASNTRITFARSAVQHVLSSQQSKSNAETPKDS